MYQVSKIKFSLVLVLCLSLTKSCQSFSEHNHGHPSTNSNTYNTEIKESDFEDTTPAYGDGDENGDDFFSENLGDTTLSLSDRRYHSNNDHLKSRSGSIGGNGRDQSSIMFPSDNFATRNTSISSKKRPKVSSMYHLHLQI